MLFTSKPVGYSAKLQREGSNLGSLGLHHHQLRHRHQPRHHLQKHLWPLCALWRLHVRHRFPPTHTGALLLLIFYPSCPLTSIRCSIGSWPTRTAVSFPSWSVLFSVCCVGTRRWGSQLQLSLERCTPIAPQKRTPTRSVRAQCLSDSLSPSLVLLSMSS